MVFTTDNSASFPIRSGRSSSGAPAAVLLAIEDGDELERLVLAYSPKFQAILNAGRREIRETGGIPHEEFWQQVEEET